MDSILRSHFPRNFLDTLFLVPRRYSTKELDLGFPDVNSHGQLHQALQSSLQAQCQFNIFAIGKFFRAGNGRNFCEPNHGSSTYEYEHRFAVLLTSTKVRHLHWRLHNTLRYRNVMRTANGCLHMVSENAANPRLAPRLGQEWKEKTGESPFPALFAVTNFKTVYGEFSRASPST